MSILPSQAYSADRPVGSASSSLGVNANPNSASSLQNELGVDLLERRIFR